MSVWSLEEGSDVGLFRNMGRFGFFIYMKRAVKERTRCHLGVRSRVAGKRSREVHREKGRDLEKINVTDRRGGTEKDQGH